MNLYRITVFHGEDWTTQWYPTKEAATKDFLQIEKDMEVPRIWLEKVVVPTDKDQLVEALNISQANPTVWPGERVY